MLRWYWALMMQTWLFCWNTGAVSCSGGPEHPEPTPPMWTHHPLLGGPACGSWKSRLLGETTSHSRPGSGVAWSGLTLQYGGGMGGGSGVVKTCPVTPRVWKHRTHKSGLVVVGCGLSGVFMIWHHQTGWWSAVSCFVWFSSANCSCTNTRSGKTCQERLWLVNRGASALQVCTWACNYNGSLSITFSATRTWQTMYCTDPAAKRWGLPLKNEKVVGHSYKWRQGLMKSLVRSKWDVFPIAYPLQWLANRLGHVMETSRKDWESPRLRDTVAVR